MRVQYFMACMTHGWGVGSAVADVCGADSALNASDCLFVERQKLTVGKCWEEEYLS
jgi:hypothetical protein